MNPRATREGDAGTDATGARSDTGIALAGQLVHLVLGYGTILLIARGAGPRALGIYSIAVFAITTARLVCMAGMPQASLRYIPLYLGADQHESVRGLLRFSSRLAGLSGTALAVLLIGAALVGGRLLFSDPALPAALAITLAGVPAYALQGTWSYALQGFQNIRQKVLVENIIEPSLRLAGLAAFLAAGATLLAGVFGLLVAVALSTIAAFAFLRRQVAHLRAGGPPRFEPRAWLAYSLPLSVSSLIALLQPGIPLLLIEYLHGAADVGVFNAAFKMAALISLPVIALNTVFAPRIAEADGSAGSRAVLGAQFKTMTAWTIALSLPLTVVLLDAATPVMRVFGPEFEPGARVLTTLAAANAVVALCGSAGCLLVMTGHSALSLANAVLGTALSVMLYVRLIPALGAPGAALAAAAGMAAAGVLALIEVIVLLRISPYSRRALTTMLAGGIAAALLAVLPGSSSAALRLLLFSQAYLVLLWLFRSNGTTAAVALR